MPREADSAGAADSADVTTLRVDVPLSAQGYDALYGAGLLASMPRLLSEHGIGGRVVVCSDSHVAALHGERLLATLAAEDASRPALWTMAAGEEHKTLATVEQAYEWLAAQRVERGDTVVALGGGVVGDLAGFAAATYLRGVRLVQAPTTLVAQVDSALGGKVGVDLPAGKNLVGAFHQPALVVADTTTLATLPEREWRAGLAEVIKHGVIRDRGLLDILGDRRDDVLARAPGVVARIVARAAAVKVDVVREDPLEQGLRRILNYGHTLGHALERVAGYGVVRHGEAVGWGMAAAARIGERVGLCHGEFVRWQDALLHSYGLLDAVSLPRVAADDLIAATRLDKKSAGGRISWILPRKPGDVVVTSDVPEEAVRVGADWLADQGR